MSGFFLPQAHLDINWLRGYEFLDKELQQVVPEAELGRRTTDKLVKVWQKSGREAWVLIHLEVQSQYETDFPERMYVYNYRLFDRYKRRVASLAILGDESPNWRPDRYGYELWGCEVDLKFPTVKLLDYRQDWDSLEQSHNPFAIIIMAHLHTQATRHQPDERYALKWTLTRRLYEQGYTKRDVQLLFRFIDWLMALPPELKRHFERTITEYEEARKMTFITSIEEIGIEKGIKQGIEQGILQKAREAVIEVLEIRFEDVPETLVEAINTLDDADILKTLHKQAVLVESIEHFTQDMDNLLADKSDQDQAPS